MLESQDRLEGRMFTLEERELGLQVSHLGRTWAGGGVGSIKDL